MHGTVPSSPTRRARRSPAAPCAVSWPAGTGRSYGQVSGDRSREVVPIAGTIGAVDEIAAPATEPFIEESAEAVGATRSDAGLIDVLEQEVADIERALERLEDGTYGTCEACGSPLDDALLAEQPGARYCRAHLPLSIG